MALPGIADEDGVHTHVLERDENLLRLRDGDVRIVSPCMISAGVWVLVQIANPCYYRVMAIVEALKKRVSVEEIAVQFGVSEPLVKFRVQKTGAQVQMRRTRSA